jgi:Helix-turn-helix domain
MRISTTSNATPQSTPPSSADSQGATDTSAGDEQFIWRSLVPRLVHPARLQIVEALIAKDGPMTVEELTPLVPHADGNADLVRYHAKAMTKAGALEVAGDNEAQSEEKPGSPPSPLP